jgi:hypothetical protein
MMGTRDSITGRGVASPRISLHIKQHAKQHGVKHKDDTASQQAIRCVYSSGHDRQSDVCTVAGISQRRKLLMDSC